MLLILGATFPRPHPAWALPSNSQGGGPGGQGTEARPAAEPLPSIEVSNPKDVTKLQTLNDTLNALSQKVTACVKAGRRPDNCQCAYPNELSSLRKGYQELIHRHPTWKDQLLSYQYINNEGRNISGTLVLQNLRRQLEMLNCEERHVK